MYHRKLLQNMMQNKMKYVYTCKQKHSPVRMNTRHRTREYNSNHCNSRSPGKADFTDDLKPGKSNFCLTVT